MLRRTITLPADLDRQVRDAAGKDESFSATVVRLLDRGLAASEGRIVPEYVGAFSGDDDLSRRVEEILGELAREAGPGGLGE